MQEREKFKQLLERYQHKQCTPEEEQRLHSWFNHYVQNEASGLDELRSKFDTDHAQSKKQWLSWLPYAAVLIISVGIAAYFWIGSNHKDRMQQYAKQNILPGGNRGMLTLADGRTVDLSETHSGIVVGNAGVSYESEAGELIDVDPKKSIQMMLSTPKGGTYQIILSDGTRVWLNAASALKYPSRFAADERVVEIDGEGYFEVAKDRSRPFKVILKGQEIEVLGTKFNVSAYQDEIEVKTTLIEGSVALHLTEVGTRMSLQPGEQSVLVGSRLTKRVVPTEPYIAWKMGNFYFDNTPLSDMMKQMSRWYNVEVVYEGEVPKELFSGTISRGVTLETVLELLRISEVKYRIEGNKLVVE